MLVEVLVKPLQVTLPHDGGVVLLRPGAPVDLPPQVAIKLLRQAKGRVRLTVSQTADWLTLWRFVAEASSGLEPTDPRLPRVLVAIQGCDAAFTQGNKAAFLTSVTQVVTMMEVKEEV